MVAASVGQYSILALVQCAINFAATKPSALRQDHARLQLGRSKFVQLRSSCQVQVMCNRRPNGTNARLMEDLRIQASGHGAASCPTKDHMLPIGLLSDLNICSAALIVILT